MLAPCPRSDFTCNDMSCIDLSKACNGHPDCPSAEDELNCTNYGNHMITIIIPDNQTPIPSRISLGHHLPDGTTFFFFMNAKHTQMSNISRRYSCLARSKIKTRVRFYHKKCFTIIYPIFFFFLKRWRH